MENLDRWRNATRKIAALAVIVAPALLSQAASAWTDPNTVATVRRLAHVAQMESTQALQTAQSYAWAGDYNEAAEIGQLRNLVASAEYLDQRAEQNWNDLSDTYGDFYQVSQNWDAAEGGLASLRGYGAIQPEIQELADAVNQLRAIYANGGNGGYNPNPYPPQPTPVPGANAGVLAREIDSEAQALLNSASQEAAYDARKTEAVNDARAVATAASQLDRDANSGWEGNLSFDIQQLSQAYNRARVSVPRSNFSVNVLRPFNHLNQLINQLGAGGSPAWR